MMKPHAKWVLVFVLSSLLLAVGALANGAASRSTTGKQTVDTRIVFARNQFSKWNDVGKGEIDIINLNGTGFRRLLSHNGMSESRPAWSPNKNRIAFERAGGIWVMDANGRHQRQLPVPPNEGAEPDWSPNGRTIVYRTSSSTGEGFCLWTINVQTGQRRQLTTTNTVSDLSPAWSPDGTRIAFARDQTIWTIRLRDHRLTQLTEGIDAWPVWSPDGRRIGFWHRGSLWVMNANGTHAHRAANGRHRPPGGGLAGFTWSADGEWIIFNVDSRGDLLAKHLDGSGLRVIRHDSGGPNGWYANSPDG